MKIPRRSRQTHLQRSSQPVLGVAAQYGPQLLTRAERRHLTLGQEPQPPLERPGIDLPRIRRRSAAYWQLPQPLVGRHAGAAPVLLLQPKIVIDQHRHALADQRATLEVPALPARCGEE